MTTVNDVYEYINSFAPFSSAEDWDNVGILVGSGKTEITKAIVSLDITCGVIDEAVKLGANLVISHHPIIFGGIKKLPIESPVYKAAAHGITCLCAHTNLDKSPVFGVNTALAQASGLINCRIADEGEILFTAVTKKPLTPDEFALQIKSGTNMDAAVFTRCCPKINKVGICSGAGGSEIYSAAAHSCDAFITGEIKHHELIFANENNISTFVLGHYKSEDVVIAPLVEKLSQTFPDVVFKKSEVFSDEIVIA